jgi:predicted Zn-dependent protease
VKLLFGGARSLLMTSRLRDRPERVRLTASSAYVHAERRWNNSMHTAVAAWTTLLTVADQSKKSSVSKKAYNERAYHQADFL